MQTKTNRNSFTSEKSKVKVSAVKKIYITAVATAAAVAVALVVRRALVALAALVAVVVEWADHGQIGLINLKRKIQNQWTNQSPIQSS